MTSEDREVLLCNVRALYRATGQFLAAEDQGIRDLEWLTAARRVVWAWHNAGPIALSKAVGDLAKLVGRPESEEEI